MDKQMIGNLLLWGGAILGAVDLAELGINVPADLIAAAMFATGTYLVSK